MRCWWELLSHCHIWNFNKKGLLVVSSAVSTVFDVSPNTFSVCNYPKVLKLSLYFMLSFIALSRLPKCSPTIFWSLWNQYRLRYRLWGSLLTTHVPTLTVGLTAGQRTIFLSGTWNMIIIFYKLFSIPVSQWCPFFGTNNKIYSYVIKVFQPNCTCLQLIFC